MLRILGDMLSPFIGEDVAVEDSVLAESCGGTPFQASPHYFGRATLGMPALMLCHERVLVAREKFAGGYFFSAGRLYYS